MSETHLSPEAELLLRCARLDLQPADRARVLRLLEEDLDWPCLLRLASRHALRPLLYRHLDAIAPSVVPKAIFVELWGCHEHTARRNQAMAKELLSILQLLDARAIAAIPYKGPALAVCLYGDLALREFGDLDILLRPQDILPAQKLLRAQGYLPDYPLSPSIEAAFLRSAMHHHLVLRNARRSVMVELHWKTDPEFPVEPSTDAKWWSELGSADLAHGKVRRFADRELLLILCLHGARHFWGSLCWLVDVAEMIRKDAQMDWDWIFARAESLGCGRRLALGLHLAHELLGAPLPDAIRRRVAARSGVARIAERLRQALFSNEGAELGPLRSLRLNLSLYERTSQRIAHLCNTLCAPSLVEWTRWPLPRAFFFLYLPIRLVRLTYKYASRPLHHN